MRKLGIFFLCLGCLTLMLRLVTNPFYFAVPNSDFFAYIDEGHHYLSGYWPYEVKFPPLYSILIVILGKLSTSAYPEYAAGVILNIFLLVSTAIILLKMNCHSLKYWSLLPVLLLISNSMTAYVNLQPLNLSMFTTIAVLVLYLLTRQKYLPAYMLATVAYFIRYEGICLIMIVAGMEFVYRRQPLRSVLLHLLAACMLPILWEVFVYFHNQNHNEYVYETVQRLKELPNWSYIRFSSFPSLFNQYQIKSSPLVFGYYLYCLIGILISWKRHLLTWQVALFWIIGYSAIHVVFPDTSSRYAYPVMWAWYLILCWPLFIFPPRIPTKPTMAPAPVLAGVCATGFIVVAIFNIRSIDAFIRASQYARLENRMLGEWLSGQTFSHPIDVITLEPWIARYFSSNPNVSFPLYQYPASSDCSFDQVLSPNRPALIVMDSYTNFASGYFANRFGVNCFKKFTAATAAAPLINLHQHNSWVRIYEWKSAF